MTEDQKAAISLISTFILEALRRQKMEEHYPSRSADEMDDYIAGEKAKVTALRSIRETLENIFSQP